MRKSFVVILLAAILVFSVISAHAATTVKYCPNCRKDTNWQYGCSGTFKRATTYSTHYVDGIPCNYYTEYYYTSLTCLMCGNVWVTDKGHVHKYSHSYDGCNLSSGCIY